MRFIIFHFNQGGGIFLAYQTADEAAQKFEWLRDNSRLREDVANMNSGRNYRVTVKMVELSDEAPDRGWLMEGGE